MKEKRLLLLSFCLLVFTIFTMAQTNDSIVLWTENFTGCYSMPNKGMHSDYSGSKCSLLFSKDAGGSSPEISISRGNYLQAKVYFYGATGTFTLRFKAKNPNGVSVYLDTPDQKHTLNTKKILANNVVSYTFEIPNNINSKKIIIKGDKKTTVDIDDIVLIAPNSCSKKGEDPKLSFSETETTAILDQNFNSPLIDNPYNQEIHYRSTDNSIAEVDEYTGKVTIKNTGEVNIIAECYGGKGKEDSFISNKYALQEVSYKLIVKRQIPDDEIFYESFNKNLAIGGYDKDFRNGSGRTEDIKFDIQPQKTSAYIAPAYKCIYFDNNNSRYDILPFTSLKDLSDRISSITFKVAGDESDNDKNCMLYVSTNGKVSSQEIYLKNSQWETHSIELKGINNNSIITFSGNNYFLDDISIVAKGDVNVSIGEYGYATLYYSDRALIVPNGMSAYSMKVDNKDNYIIPSKIYSEGYIIPKGEAVVLKAKEGNYVMQITDNEVEKDPFNQLMGTDYKSMTTNGDLYYLFGANRNTKEVGFYWGNENGAPFENGAHKAYLPIQKDSYITAKSLPIVFDNILTSEIRTINKTINNNSEEVPSYTLSGSLIPTSYRGIVIRKGRKFIRR